VTPAALWRRWVALFEDEDDSAARYDPFHLAAVLVGCMAAVGALFWLMWTLLVYEGGLPTKLAALVDFVFRGKSLADLGRTGGADREGVFEGWAANLVAFLVSGLLLAALQRLDRRRARNPR
jgi:hypothetical protein